MMKELLRNWNYAKHACVVTTVYLMASIVGNLLLGTPKKMKNAERGSVYKCVKQLSRKQKIFNAAVTGCYLFDMTASYGIIKLLQKKIG